VCRIFDGAGPNDDNGARGFRARENRGCIVGGNYGAVEQYRQGAVLCDYIRRNRVSSPLSLVHTSTSKTKLKNCLNETKYLAMIRARVEAQNAHCEIAGGEKIIHRDGRDPIEKDVLFTYVPTAVTKSAAADGTHTHIYMNAYVCACMCGSAKVGVVPSSAGLSAGCGTFGQVDMRPARGGKSLPTPNE
jgi:hypothetical protein